MGGAHAFQAALRMACAQATEFIDPSVAMYNTLYSDRILLRQRLQNTVRKQLNSPTLRQIKKRPIPPSWDVGRDPR